jgi:hypothetical protein
MEKKDKVTDENKTNFEYELMYSEEISKIDNCPLVNESGRIEVVRLVKNKPATEDDLIPHSKLYPKLADNCIAWGLSVYKKPKVLKDINDIMSKRLKGKFTIASSFVITDEMGVKYQTTDNLSHYTFFPKKELDLLSTFATENI